MTDNCLFCENKNTKIKIIDFNYWYIEHAINTSIESWLLIILKKHKEALHELEIKEWEELSTIFYIMSNLLRDITKCKKEYIMQIAEGERTHHIHFHIVSRHNKINKNIKGRKIFNAFGDNITNKITNERLLELVNIYKKQLKN